MAVATKGGPLPTEMWRLAMFQKDWVAQSDQNKVIAVAAAATGFHLV